MKVAIVGSGAIGLYYGAKLALAGEDVVFWMRSGLEEAREKGIRIAEEDGSEWGLDAPVVASNTSDIGAVDVVIIALKSTSNSLLAEALPPLLGKETLLLTLQNGIGIEEELAGQFPGHPVAGGLCFICLSRLSPTRVRHVGQGALTLGQLGGAPGERLVRLAKLWETSGVQVRVSDDLFESRWKKLIWNIPFNGLGVAAGGVGVDRILASPELFQRCRDLMTETRETANAMGCSISQEFLEHQIERTYPMGDYHASTVLDYLAGRPLEIDAIWERPLLLAKSRGMEMPLLEKLHGELVEIGKKQGK